jgi:hypothetical protein
MLTTSNQQTESSLQTYSQFANQTAIPPKPTEDERRAEARVQELLDKVRTHPLPPPLVSPSHPQDKNIIMT